MLRASFEVTLADEAEFAPVTVTFLSMAAS
jgi:hypothetical protein